MAQKDRFNKRTFYNICNTLAAADEDLKKIIDQYGYPPYWHRKPSFEGLIHFILEQQVSLASAMAALQKLQQKLPLISPKNILALTDEELKACYFSRQKIKYTRSLANAFLNKQIVISKLANAPADEVRIILTKVNGIGNWTVDVFLMMSLHRCDHFPLGDLALIKSIKIVKKLPDNASHGTIMQIADQWRPYRTIATYLLWHHYLESRKK